MHDDVQEGHVRQEELPHAAQHARRLGLEQRGEADHSGVERDLARVVADHQAAAHRQVLDPGVLDAEPVAVEDRGGEKESARRVGVIAPRVVLVFVQVCGCPRQLLVDLVGELREDCWRQRLDELAQRTPGGEDAVRVDGLSFLVHQASMGSAR
jgi:hypothetical protein